MLSCRQAIAQEKSAGDRNRTLVLQRGHSDATYSLALSHDGKWLVTGGTDGQVKVWETATGREMRSFKGHLDEINDLCFSDDGQWLATCSGGALIEIDEAKQMVRLVDATVRLWNVATGCKVRTFGGSSTKTTRVAFSHDGKRLATLGDDELARLWNTATGKVMHSLRHGSREQEHFFPKALIFSNDDKRLFTADDRVRVWDVASGRLVREFKPHNPKVKTNRTAVIVKEVVGSESVSRDKVDEWEERTCIDQMVLIPDGKQLITVGSDHRVVVWNAETAEALHVHSSLRVFAVTGGYSQLADASK